MRCVRNLSLPAWHNDVQLTRADFARYVAVVCGVAIVIALRQPSSFARPQFAVEDGAIFFAQAYNLSLLEALLKPYAGYWHFVPRLVAEFGSVLSPEWAPLFYSSIALLLTSGSISWFILPLHGSIVANAWIRLLVILLIAISPSLDAPTLIAYGQWYLAFWAILVSIAAQPSSRPVRWLVAAFYPFIILSAPALIILVPIWILRWWSSTTDPSRNWSRFIALTLLLVSALFFLSSESFGVINFRLGMALHDALNGLTYHAVTIAFLGLDIARALITNMGWWSGYAIAFLVFGCLALAFALDPRPGKQALGVYLLYVAIAATLLYIRRSTFYKFPFVDTSNGLPYAGSRYFLFRIQFFCYPSQFRQSACVPQACSVNSSPRHA